MSTGYTMVDVPNRIYTQGQVTRRDGNVPVGLAVIHTFEIAPDYILPDLSAETGLNYLRGRDTPGCYHRLADSDSRIALYPFMWETWQCRFTNKWSNGFCMATRADQWRNLPQWHADAMMQNCARDVAAFVIWEKEERGVTVPMRWVTREQALAKQPGLTMHRITDPTRRSDPGFTASMAARFLEMVADYSKTPGEVGVLPNPTSPGLRLDGDFGEYTIKALQRALNAVGEDAGPVDGDFGPRTRRAYQHWLARCGFYPGAIDGDFGCMSMLGEQRWLRSHGLYNERLFCGRDGLVVYALQNALNKGKIQ